jgi:phosphatidylinositol 4-kinase
MVSKWKAHVRTAWNFSPKFALQMAIRFPMEIIRLELQRLVRQYAAEVTHLHEAVTYLVTPQTIEEDIPEFQYLLYWAPSTLSTALTFLNYPYVKNPMVGQYAIRTLRRFTPDAVVFYLPQIIQCLRHDVTGQLNRYLISVSTHRLNC